MGVHYSSMRYLMDGVLDPRKPEQLLYVRNPSGSGFKLAGVEYHTDDADQNLMTDPDRPTMFSRPFDGPMPGHGPGAAIHFDLHVWMFERNPSGMFAQFNPAASCVLALESVSVPRSLRAARTVSRGVPVKVRVGRPGSRIRATLRLGGTVIGRASFTARRAGLRRFAVRPTLRGVRSVDRTLRRRRSVPARLQIDATQPGGLREKRVSRITLRR